MTTESFYHVEFNGTLTIQAQIELGETRSLLKGEEISYTRVSWPKIATLAQSFVCLLCLHGYSDNRKMGLSPKSRALTSEDQYPNCTCIPLQPQLRGDSLVLLNLFDHVEKLFIYSSVKGKTLSGYNIYERFS